MTAKTKEIWSPMEEAARIAMGKLQAVSPGKTYGGGKYSDGPKDSKEKSGTRKK
jgi:hypothetical protein